MYIIVEKCAGGNLFDRILSGKTYNEKIASELCADILRVAEQCHERGVIHRDIKPENFLFCLPPLVKTDSQEEDCIGLPPLKMTDFGLAEKYTGKPLTEISGTLSLYFSRKAGASSNQTCAEFPISNAGLRDAPSRRTIVAFAPRAATTMSARSTSRPAASEHFTPRKGFDESAHNGGAEAS